MDKKLLRLLARPLSQQQKTKLWRLLLRLRYRLHTRLGEYPDVLFKIYSLFDLYSDYIVNQDCALVIDAFPRSGSTFAVYAFHLAQQGHPVKVACHLHVPAHIIRACKLNVPSLVIIRDPKEAVSSAIIREPYLSIKEYLLRYKSFYTRLESCRGQFFLAHFDQVVNHFDEVIYKLNKRYGTSFQEFDYTRENLAHIEHQMHLRHQQYGGDAGQSYLPNPIKQKAKQSVDFQNNETLLKQCDEIYQRYLTYFD